MPTLPIVVPNSFAGQSGPIPLVQLDQNLGTIANTVNGMSNGTVQIPVMNITTANIGALAATSFTGNVAITGGTGILAIANVSTLNVSSIPALTGNAGVTITQGPASITVSGTAASAVTNALGGDVSLANVALFFDGPSVNAGNVGTWFVSGTVTCADLNNNATFDAKLWDGATVISSTRYSFAGTTSLIVPMTLSGVITSPAGNLKISVRESNFTTGNIKANQTGTSKDSTITAYRIG